MERRIFGACNSSTIRTTLNSIYAYERCFLHGAVESARPIRFVKVGVVVHTRAHAARWKNHLFNIVNRRSTKINAVHLSCSIDVLLERESASAISWSFKQTRCVDEKPAAQRVRLEECAQQFIASLILELTYTHTRPREILQPDRLHRRVVYVSTLCKMHSSCAG